MTIDRGLVERALASATDTRHLVLRPGGLAETAEIVGRVAGDRPVVVIADETTWAVAGETVDRALRAAGRAVLPAVRLPAAVHAEYARVLELEAALAGGDAVPVAVGSGTVNDLTKLAAHRLGRPYVVAATAASMDGYAAFGASITRDGFKQTMSCAAPAGIVADVDLLTTAPTRLTGSGYGDLLGKVTAGADWLVADALGVDPLDRPVWRLVQEPLRSALDAPERLRAGDPAAAERFFLGLVLSGLAMQAAQSSRPASGAEHLLSHLWEMTGPWENEGAAHGNAAPSHGHKVGVGTVLVTALYERLLRHDLTRVDVEARVADWPDRDAVERAVRAALPAGEIADRAVAESLAKHPSPAELRARLLLLRERWPALRERLAEQLLPTDELQRRLRALGAPATPAELGITGARLRSDLLAARRIRRRYTVLDLAAEAGLLDAGADDVVARLAPR